MSVKSGLSATAGRPSAGRFSRDNVKLPMLVKSRISAKSLMSVKSRVSVESAMLPNNGILLL